MKEVERYRRRCKKLNDLNYNINISLVLTWSERLACTASLWPWVRNLHHCCHTKRSRKRKIKNEAGFQSKAGHGWAETFQLVGKPSRLLSNEARRHRITSNSRTARRRRRRRSLEASIQRSCPLDLVVLPFREWWS